MNSEQQLRVLRSLGRKDDRLRPIIKQYAPLDFYNKKPKPAFHTLVSMIINQQLSLKAAKTIEGRLLIHQGGRHFSAKKLAAIPELKSFGVSRQKQNYIHALARGVVAGDLNFRRLRLQGNDDVRKCLLAYPGIGPWTVDVFLLANFHREDVFPAGDLILQKFLQRHFALPDSSKYADYARFAERWQPHRSLVSLLFWKAAHMNLEL